MRFAFVDTLRGFAIFCMVAIHTVRFLLRDQTGELFALFEILGTIAAPLFLFIVGFSLVLSSRKDFTAHHVKRAFALIVIGLLFMFIWEADVLHFIGLFILLAIPLRKLSPAILLSVTALFVVASPYVRSTVGYAQYWNVMGWEQNITINSFVPQLLTAGFHPLFPWFAFVVLGIAIGKIFLSMKSDLQIFRKYMVLIGALFIVLSLLLSRDIPITFYPASTLYMVLQIGILFVFTGATASLSEKSSPLSLLGKNSLSIYLFHILLILGPFMLMNALFTQGWTVVSLLLVIWLAAFYFDARALEKYGKKAPFEKLIGKC